MIPTQTTNKAMITDYLHTGTERPEGAEIRTWRIPLSIAPMMQRTDRHFRYMMRIGSKHTLLWSEMITAKAIIHGDREHLLAFDGAEHPIVLQLGGDDPTEMAEAARIGQDFGYDEININVGCPSSRVGSGGFGACLMARPEVVAECVEAMATAVTIPVTVKHRIGIDDIDQYEDMERFVRIVSDAGASARFTVHARKAWLSGLSPKENRNIPPLRYHEVYRLKQEFPKLVIEINGGIKTIAEIKEHLEHVDAAMLGRAAYDTPYMFARADREIFGDASARVVSRHEWVEEMLPYIERWVSVGGRLHHVTQHMINLFYGCPGAKRWRRYISERHSDPSSGAEVVREALRLMDRELMREAG